MPIADIICDKCERRTDDFFTQVEFLCRHCEVLRYDAELEETWVAYNDTVIEQNALRAHAEHLERERAQVKLGIKEDVSVQDE